VVGRYWGGEGVGAGWIALRRLPFARAAHLKSWGSECESGRIETRARGGGVKVTVPAASHEQLLSLPRRRTALRSWVVLVLALLGALLALLLGGLRGAQLASASPLPDTCLAAQRSATPTVQVCGSAAVDAAGDQWRSTSPTTSDGVTQPSPRVTPKTSVVGPMRRSDHGANPVAQTQSSVQRSAAVVVDSTGSSGGVPSDLAVCTTPVLAVLLGGAILVLRGNPRRLRVVPTLP
jgi:hypothetical protein